MEVRKFFEIMRPINCFLGSLTVFIGILNSVGGAELKTFLQEDINIFKLVTGMVIFFVVAGGTNTINDFFDVEIDKINRPNRTIVRGSFNKQQVVRYYIFLNSIAFLLSIIIGVLSPNPILIPLVVILFQFAGFFYSWKAKASGLLGNLLVGFASAVGFPFAALFVVNFENIGIKIWYIFVLAFFLLTSREFVKGMEDVEGDRKYNIKTIANTQGYLIAFIYLIVFSLITIILFIIAIFLYGTGTFFTLSAVGGCFVIILANMVLLKDISNKKLHSISSQLLKIAQIFGISTFVATAI
jgi:geranylgeranylglycerol-phosphate geranylgeranyltransferase